MVPKIQIYNGNGTEAQKFKFTATDYNPYSKSYEDGYYIISSLLNDNMVIDADNASKRNGTNVQLYASNKTLAQIWYLKYLGDGVLFYYQFYEPKCFFGCRW